MPLERSSRRREITLNVSPYVYDVDAVALSLINQFKADGADPEVTKLGDHKLSLTFRENDELTYEVACQKILWNQYVQNIEQKNVTNNIELLKKLVDPYFESPVVANINGPVNEVLGDGKGQLDGISPSAFNHGEVLWADGKPMPHPEYNLDLGIRPEGPPLLVRDINKAVQPSTITAFIKHYANSEEMEDHFHRAILWDKPDKPDTNACKFCGEPEYMAWEHKKIETRRDIGLMDFFMDRHKINQQVSHRKTTCPLCIRDRKNV